jgi:hypothetical protein
VRDAVKEHDYSFNALTAERDLERIDARGEKTYRQRSSPPACELSVVVPGEFGVGIRRVAGARGLSLFCELMSTLCARRREPQISGSRAAV